MVATRNVGSGSAPVKRALITILLSAVATLSGCAKPDISCPVRGQIRINSKPEESVYVILQHPGASASSARTEAAGYFSTKVEMPGEYAVNLFWPEIIEQADEVAEGKDRLSGKYRNPSRPATTVVIVEGANDLPPINVTYP